MNPHAHRRTVGPRTSAPSAPGVHDPNRPSRATLMRRAGSALLLAAIGGLGFVAGVTQAAPASAPSAAPAAAPAQQGGTLADLATLRVYGDEAICSSCRPGEGNLPNTAGVNAPGGFDPNTGLLAEDPPYTDPEGPFSPLSSEAPEHDFVTWDPAWISELLDDPALQAEWPGLRGADEVSAGLPSPGIRYDGQNGSQKVWLRHWYEPTRLDKDLNADDCLTDEENDGRIDAPVNPTPSNDDEWYPAIMTELTYMLLENRAPVRFPEADALDDSAPRPACGRPGRTQMVFPVGMAGDELDNTELVGYGLTSLDVDFDGEFDLLRVSDEATVGAELGVDVDFDGDGPGDVLDPDGTSLTCDEMVVLHTEAITLGAGDRLQLLDHFVEIQRIADSSAVLAVSYTGDLVARQLQPRSVGVGALALAGDTGVLQVIQSGAGNVGVPSGPWFVAVQAVDVEDGTATLVVGRAIGAPCASMEAGPNQANLSVGGPWFLKRFYVDGHEYNVVAIHTCDSGGLQYITLRAPLPKVPVTIEQHSVRLQPYGFNEGLTLPPPFNHEHTTIEDINYFEGFLDIEELLGNGFADDRPLDLVRYMGGPMGPTPPVLNAGDGLTYEGRNPNAPVGPYDDYLSTHWFYVDEATYPPFVGQLREKFGAVATDANGSPIDPSLPGSFFFNEQIFTRPWNFTEFVLPNQPDPAVDPDTGAQPYDPDAYLLTSGFESPTTRWRRWIMPDSGVPETFPPAPPDLIEDVTGFDGDDSPQGNGIYGGIRRASILFDPDISTKIQANNDGARLYSGFPIDFEDDMRVCDGPISRPSIVFGAGNWNATDQAGYPVEVPPYTDPFAPFNPQHPDAPRTDSLTFNPAYLDEFRNFGEDLRGLYRQIANNAQNARMKVYHRLWYQPDYVTKIRYFDDCDRDLSYLAMMQEFTYLFMDTTDNPIAVPPGSSRIAFPLGTRAEELPVPEPGGGVPNSGEFGYGLTSYDANFDGFDDAATIHTESTLIDHMDTQWQANRPEIPGVPQVMVPGPALDFDGDLITDTLDADCTALNGNEMVVFAVESLTLDLDEDTPEGHAAMFLDHMVALENVTPGSDMQVRFYFTGGNASDARPERVNGIYSLEIGDAAIVDRFQDRVTLVSPGEANIDVDGAWFVFLEDVATDAERVTITIGRALGATHSAIDDGFGSHDLAPGDPWYLKRFYVDGHEYNVVALFTENGPQGCNQNFSFITIRTPVPKGNFFNPQDTLFQQGYFLNGLPDEMSVMPPFNVDHTIAVDVERKEAEDFAFMDRFDACVGELAPAEPLVERITAETREPRFGNELRETFNESDDSGTGPEGRLMDGWETHQVVMTPWDYTEVQVPDGQNYLLTLDWRSDVSRLAVYGCTRDEPGPFAPGPDRDAFGDLVPNPPPLSHDDIADAAGTWPIPPPHHIPGVFLPAPNQSNPAQPFEPDDILPYFDGFCPGGERLRVKIFYDPTDTDDVYVNEREVRLPTRFADLRLEKRSSRPTASAGDEIIYTVTVHNDGPDDAPDATVVDVLPEGVSYIGDTDDCSEGPTGTLTCAVGELAAGNSRSFALLVALDDDLDSGTELVNRARVTAFGAIDPDPSNNSAEAAVIVRNEADLTIRKTASDLTPRPGQQLVYLITVVNGGPAVAEDVIVTDTLPVGLTYVADTGGCATVDLPDLTCHLGDLAVGASRQFAVTVEVDANIMAGTTLSNRVRVISSGSDPNPEDNRAISTVIVTAEADLQVSKTPATESPAAGDLLSWTVVVTNAGPQAAGIVQVLDELPDGLSYVSDTDACVQAPVGSLTCDVGPLAAGESTSFEIVTRLDADLPAGTSLDNVVSTMTMGIQDPDPTNNRDSATVVTTTSADLDLDKRAPRFARAGEEMVYALVVTNHGPSDATDVTITDTLPVSVTYVASTGDACAPTVGREIVCAVGDLDAGDDRTIQVRVALDAGLLLGARLVNQATVGSPVSDPDPSNNDDDAVTRVITNPEADLSLEKSAPATAAAGSALSYVLSVSNDGPSVAANVRVTDTLPAGVSYVSSSGDACSVDSPGVLVCDFGRLRPGGNRTVIITVEIGDDVRIGTVLVNSAVVGSDTRDPSPGDESDSARTTVTDGSVPEADLRIHKSAPATIDAGSVMTYEITLGNGSGTTAAVDAVVTDALPEGVSYLSDTSPGGCSEDAPGVLTCEIGTLAPGATLSFSIRVGVDASLEAGEILSNSASVAADTADPNGGNNESSADTTVTRLPNGTEADLRVVKTVNTDPVIAGLDISYTIRVDNLGPAYAPRVVLTDTLPAALSYVSADAECEERTPGGREIVCELGGLFAGEGATIILTAHVASSVAAGASLVNVAEVGLWPAEVPVELIEVGLFGAATALAARPMADPMPENDLDSAASEVERLANLGLGKQALRITPAPGDTVDWVVRVRNAGPSDADGVTIADSLSDGLSYVADSAGCGAVALAAGCDVGTLPAGATTYLTLTTQVDGQVPVGTTLVDPARVDADDPDPNGEDNEAAASAVVAPPTIPMPRGLTCRAQGTDIALAWGDGTDFETAHVVEAALSGTRAWVQLGSQPSADAEGTGAPLTHLASGLAAGQSYDLRVGAVADEAETLWSDTVRCSTVAAPPAELACYQGRLDRQGRADQSGVTILSDGAPVATTDSSGDYAFCVAPAPMRTLSTRAACYLEATSSFAAQAGTTVNVPATSLPGGDTDDNTLVNLFDLVRVGANYRLEPPNDSRADCTGDGKVDLFDLVLVGANYGGAGPVSFGHQGPVAPSGSTDGAAGATLDAVRETLGGLLDELLGGPWEGNASGASGTAPELPIDAARAPLSAPRVTIATQDLGNGRIAVEVRATDVRNLWGADVRLAYDPARLAPASEVPTAGPAWSGTGGFVAETTLAEGMLSFGATRIAPAEAVGGDVALFTVELEQRSSDLEGALRLESGAAGRRVGQPHHPLRLAPPVLAVGRSGHGMVGPRPPRAARHVGGARFVGVTLVDSTRGA